MLKKYLEEKYGKGYNSNIFIINKLRMDNLSFSHFYFLMKHFEEPAEQLKKYCKLLEVTKTKLPLPSGRLGNPLAVALEMHKYKVALDMIQKPNEYGISLDKVSTGEGCEPWSANDVFDFSLLTYEEKSTNDEDMKRLFTDDQREELERVSKEEKTAAEEIVNIFSKKM